MDNAHERYIELTSWIRELSTPQISVTDSAETYRKNLLGAFRRIGELARVNEQILRESFYPLMDPERDLSDDDIERMREFCQALMDPTSMENLDLPMIYLQSERLLADAEKKGDERVILLALDNMVMAAYTMFSVTQRLYPCFDICFAYRDLGISSAERILSYLPKEKFEKLPDDYCRETVLINSRYISALFEWSDMGDQEAEARVTKDLRMMEEALALGDDPFYLEAAPDYDWKYHVFRTLQYISCFTEYGNISAYPDDLRKKIHGYTQLFLTFLKEETPEMEGECTKETQELYLLRSAFYAHEISGAKYREGLRKLFRRRDMNTYGAGDFYTNFTVPYEYIINVDQNNLTEQDKKLILTFYREMVRHIYHMPKKGVLSFLLGILSEILKHFIEIPGGPDFETLCLHLMAALHPPTYVHSLSVTEITVCLCEHLLRREPERFIGMFDTESAEDVIEQRHKILDYAEHAALLHDTGKLFVLETIITYGRKLFDEEFDLIRAHPVIGAYLLSLYDSTRPYADAALAHHRFYNNGGGYPETFDMASCKEKAIIAVLAVADCLDAATDTVGRSYKSGKTLEEYIGELEAEKGTRYADFAVDLLYDEEVRFDIAHLLESVRDENYRRTFALLWAL